MGGEAGQEQGEPRAGLRPFLPLLPLRTGNRPGTGEGEQMEPRFPPHHVCVDLSASIPPSLLIPFFNETNGTTVPPYFTPGTSPAITAKSSERIF